MKRLIFPLFILLSLHVSAQRLSIDGMVTDTLNIPLVRATVMLLGQDSTLIEYTQSGIDGYFSFKRLEAGEYIVKMTYVGYIPMHINVELTDAKVDLGKVRLTEIATEIMEVVIKAARAPMKMIGDTLEYDISTFKVPEGSTVEDLLRRLPSMQVERDGTILSEGKVVSKVTVEGKDFFGGDPRTVTKNLPAHGVSKVQVFDHKSEEEILTGIEGNAEEKAMNLQLKEEFRNGVFGKIVAGYGTEERMELKGNYNSFNDKHQFSLVGVGNNTGRNGLDWDDYQDFMGSSSFNFFSRNLEYGFGSGGHFRSFRFGGSGNNLESQISSAFFSGSSGGYPRNASGGINYNYDHNSNKLGARYFYNYNDNQQFTTSRRTTYYQDFASDRTSESDRTEQFGGHRAELSYETEIDSMHTFMISTNLAYANSGDQNVSYSASVRDDGIRITDSEVDNSSDFGGKLIKTTALLRKSFKKKGRFLGLNFTHLYTDVADDFETHSLITFYDEADQVEEVQQIDRLQFSLADKNAFNGNAMYSEPLSKSWFLGGFYNFSSTRQKGVVDVEDIEENTVVANDYLSREYDNRVLYQRVGTQLTYSNEGLNITLGGAFKQMGLRGDYRNRELNGLEGKVDQTFHSWLPYLSASYRLRRTMHTHITLSRNESEPSIDELLPVVDDRNPLLITEGNPELEPRIQSSVDLNLHYSIPVTGFRIYFRAGYDLVETDIINEETVDNNLITYVRPVNYKGGIRLSGNTGVGIPIWGEKLRANVRISANYSESFGLVNQVENETAQISFAPGLTVDIMPAEWLSLFLNGSTRRASTSYNINTSQDQEIITNTVGVEMNLKFGSDFGWESSYDHSFYTNERFGVDESIPLINSSVYWRFLKGKKGTLRFSAYDILNKNVGFSQYAGSNFVSSSSTQSLARYFMLSFTYDIRGGSPKGNGKETRIMIRH